jgi:hypothetical protein
LASEHGISKRVEGNSRDGSARPLNIVAKGLPRTVVPQNRRSRSKLAYYFLSTGANRDFGRAEYAVPVRVNGVRAAATNPSCPFWATSQGPARTPGNQTTKFPAVGT